MTAPEPIPDETLRGIVDLQREAAAQDFPATLDGETAARIASALLAAREVVRDVIANEPHDSEWDCCSFAGCGARIPDRGPMRHERVCPITRAKALLPREAKENR